MNMMSASPCVNVISPDFNRAVTDMIPRLNIGYTLVADGSKCDTLDKVRRYYDSTGRIPVWTGASDNTIFGYRHINWAFRAWHDYIHIKHDLPFTREGELEALRIHKEQLSLLHGDTFDVYLECEIRGQLDYLEAHGEFPSNQFEFACHWIPANRYKPSSKP